MTKEEKELFRFVAEPKYREKMLSKSKKEEDKKYQNNVKMAQNERDRLINLRQQEISRIENSRWEVYANGNLRINFVEGCITLNGNKVLFSSVKGAEFNSQDGVRTVITETSTTKRNPSIGGAVAGGLIGGRAGAVIGGAGLNKARTTTNSYTNSIPTCNHMGVVIDIDGFKQEVTIINSQVDQSSKIYMSAYNEAQQIIMRLREVSHTPVPQSFIPAHEMKSVKDIEKQIDGANEKLNFAINNRPQYKIPVKYRTQEQSHMTDEEYLNYLREEDTKRAGETKQKGVKEKTIKVKDGNETGSHAMSVSSLVLGIVGLILTIFVVGIVPSIVGLTLGIVALVSGKPKRGMAIAGVSVSAIAIVFFFALLISIM